MKFTYLSILIALIFTISACSPEPPEKNEVNEIEFKVTYTANGNNLQFEGPYFDLPDGSSVNSTRISSLLSNFYLKDADGNTISLSNQYGMLKPQNGVSSFTLNNIPMGNYQSLGFTLGLDSSINYGDPNQYAINHPLSPVYNNLYWGWAGGYIFLALEGRLKDTAATYIFHIGGNGNTVDYEFPINFVKEENKLIAEIEFKLEECFQNPNLFSFKDDGIVTHSPENPITDKILQNLPTAFRLNSIHE